MKMASRAQTWTLFKMTGRDYRNDSLTYQQASDLIQAEIAKKEAVLGAFRAVFDEAREAGMAAGTACVPRPMGVVEHSNPLDDNSPIVNAYHVPEGVCGFAWVIIKPGNSRFANWLKREGHARPDSYYGGVCHWVSDFGQSYERKQAYATAFAAVLNKHNYRAQSMSRLD